MKKYICNDLIEIKGVIKQLQLGNCVFRGQSSIGYKLQTRLASKCETKGSCKILDTGASMLTDFYQGLIQKNLDSHFYEDRFPFPKPNFKNNWLFKAQAQHYGIPTCLMDWSRNYQSALFFTAIDKPENDNLSGQLWVLDTTGIMNNPDSLTRDCLYLKDPQTINDYAFLFVASEEDSQTKLPMQRIYQQDGGFLVLPNRDLITPLEERQDFVDRLTLIEITPNCKKEIKKALNKGKEVIGKDISGNKINGIRMINGVEKIVFDDSFFYGSIPNDLLVVINDVRKNNDFDEISS